MAAVRATTTPAAVITAGTTEPRAATRSTRCQVPSSGTPKGSIPSSVVVMTVARDPAPEPPPRGGRDLRPDQAARPPRPKELLVARRTVDLDRVPVVHRRDARDRPVGVPARGARRLDARGRDLERASGSRSASPSARSSGCGKGPQAGGEYLAGYLIEKSLSVDNIFVFALIFGYFAVPAAYQHRVLFWGVFGALVFRAIFIAAGATLLDQFHWMIYVFGAFLVFTGIRMARSSDEHVDPGKNPVLRAFRRFVPMTDGLRDERFFVKEAGRRLATPAPRGARGHGDDRHHLRDRLDPGDLRRDDGHRSSCSPRTPSRSWGFGPSTSCSRG